MPTEKKGEPPVKQESPPRSADKELDADAVEQVARGATLYPDGPQYDR